MAEKMNAVFAKAPGGPEVLEVRSVPIPEPAPGEILIRVEAAGVNRPDLNQRKGGYPPPAGITEVLGLEVAGEIVACGSAVESFQPGEKVCALVAGGGYAEYCVAPAQQALPWPAGLSAVEAAALPETFFTVWTNLFRLGLLKRGESVLIHGGASGIGTTAIQLAKAFGAQVFATAGSSEKCERCEELGARSINYRNEPFEQRIQELTEGTGVNVILDMVCAEYLERNLSCLAIGGRLVVIAFLGGGQAELNIEAMVRRRQAILGSTLRPQSIDEKGVIARELKNQVWPLLEDREVLPIINSVHKLSNASAAHTELEAGDHFGKVVLTT
ncbi:NAD(P)H-quinone oxidoreductase [Fodinicurvata sediminis]|uniref:NAD(P)H-quinone oxidoreductase n=1 Tax=Fodinicurvata sediminis TaxID=1121832 RepID=UPI0003B35BDC|nr:NAD(P)H-quinone oxidoreductase [Fodinicurvata sediminis]